MDNRDFQSQLDKASQESEIKPFTIQDLIRFAERDGINCGNCMYFKNDIYYCIIKQNNNGINHFCADFKPKDKLNNGKIN